MYILSVYGINQFQHTCTCTFMALVLSTRHISHLYLGHLLEGQEGEEGDQEEVRVVVEYKP